MKKTILTQIQLAVLEQLLAEVGPIVKFDQITRFLPQTMPAAQRQFVHRLAQAGWLVRIKKGLYQVADLSSLGTLTLSRYTVAQLLVPESYVSFESALHYHGLYDQLMRGTTSVALKQHATVERQEYAYAYVKTARKYFYGWHEHAIDGRMVSIAAPEKALIDIIQFHRTESTTDVVREKLFEYQDALDWPVLHTYLTRATLTTQRIFGFLLDSLKLDSSPLQDTGRQSLMVSKLTPHSTVYNAKWRLYYEPCLMQAFPQP
ncbi:MAG: hypothetical protein M3Q45_09685 [Chloroflexota bacterium]|nr:hypothetical protein [Chloroflexota bacterium]